MLNIYIKKIHKRNPKKVASFFSPADVKRVICCCILHSISDDNCIGFL